MVVSIARLNNRTKKTTNLNNTSHSDMMAAKFREIVGCPATNRCFSEMSKTNLTTWLTNTADRDSKRIKNTKLNYADFESLRKTYGEAWAKKVVVSSRWMPDDMRSYVYNDGDEDDLIVGEKDFGLRDQYVGRLEADVSDYAEDMIAIMDTSKNGTVSSSEFISYMVKKK